MSADRSAALYFLLTRRSIPARMLAEPVPDRARLERILTAAARVPDHGKLEPWRFVVLTRPALARLAALVEAVGAARGEPGEAIAKQRAAYADSPLAVAVVASPKPSEKIPAIEQTLSVGAACMALLNAALADGWGANWLTGWPAYDARFRAEGLGLSPEEWVAGIVHIGTPAGAGPERPRPDLARIVTWAEA